MKIKYVYKAFVSKIGESYMIGIYKYYVDKDDGEEWNVQVATLGSYLPNIEEVKKAIKSRYRIADKNIIVF